MSGAPEDSSVYGAQSIYGAQSVIGVDDTYNSYGGNELYDDTRIRDRMESRRAVMEMQIQSDAIKSQLCDSIQEKKRSVKGLSDKVRALEDSDPDLFNYIRTLEYIQYGVWCPKCNIPKQIGGRPNVPADIVPISDDSQTSTQNPTQISNDQVQDLRREYRTIEANLQSVMEAATTLHNEYVQKSVQLTQLAQLISKLQNDLIALAKRIDVEPSGSLPAPTTSTPTTPATSTTTAHTASTTPTAMFSTESDSQSISMTVKKEDLPAKPVFDIDELIDQKFALLCANDLLEDY